MKYIIFAGLFAHAASADPMAVHTTAHDIFGRVPDILVVDDMRAHCGLGPDANPHIGYCTSDSTIYLSTDFMARPSAAYEMAHVLGHAIQVQHGVADVALREIRSRRDEEDALRGMVTRQVECVSGVLVARAGLENIDLGEHYHEEPFTDAHWGRRPINRGPRVSIGLEARKDWFEIGFSAADFEVCTVGEMSADLIVQAAR